MRGPGFQKPWSPLALPRLCALPGVPSCCLSWKEKGWEDGELGTEVMGQPKAPGWAHGMVGLMEAMA